MDDDEAYTKMRRKDSRPIIPLKAKKPERKEFKHKPMPKQYKLNDIFKDNILLRDALYMYFNEKGKDIHLLSSPITKLFADIKKHNVDIARVIQFQNQLIYKFLDNPRNEKIKKDYKEKQLFKISNSVNNRLEFDKIKDSDDEAD